MRLFILTLAIFILIGCVSRTSSTNEASNTAQPTSAAEDSNATAKPQNSDSKYQYDQTLLDKLNAVNEQFRQVSDEFKSVDFKNFNYDFGRLNDGEFEKEYSKKFAQGGEKYNFRDVFYVDLIGDAKKEAIVFISKLSCGGSCDGGSYIVYFYSSNKERPALIDALRTGTKAYGCSIKSFSVKDKKINVEQFGKCVKNTTGDYKNDSPNKFIIKDETHSVYSINKNGLKRQSADVVETETVNVMNAPAFISVTE